MNAVEHEPVPTRVLNPNASEASYKPKQRSYRKRKLHFFFREDFYLRDFYLEPKKNLITTHLSTWWSSLSQVIFNGSSPTAWQGRETEPPLATSTRAESDTMPAPTDSRVCQHTVTLFIRGIILVQNLFTIYIVKEITACSLTNLFVLNKNSTLDE